MIEKVYIEKSLVALEQLYNNSNNKPDEAMYYSKLAILELCGWIELSMDDILRNTANRLLCSQDHRKKIDGIIKKNYGFQYEEHFKKMLLSIVGYKGIYEIEQKVNSSLFYPMCSILKKLYEKRNTHAHQDISGTTKHFDAPSLIISDFNRVYTGLVDIDNVLNTI